LDKKIGTIIGGSDDSDISYLRILTRDGDYHNKHYFANSGGYNDVLECVHAEAAEKNIILEPMTINFH